MEEGCAPQEGAEVHVIKRQLELTPRNAGCYRNQCFLWKTPNCIRIFCQGTLCSHAECGKPSSRATGVSEFGVMLFFFYTLSCCDCILLKAGNFKAFLIFPFAFTLPCSLKNGIRFCFLQSSCRFLPVLTRTEQNTRAEVKLKSEQNPSKTSSTSAPPIPKLRVAKRSVLGASQSVVKQPIWTCWFWGRAPSEPFKL